MAISKEYQEQLEELHSKVDSFGKRSKLPDEFKDLLDNVEFNSILDFGAGKGNVFNTLVVDYPNATVHAYDPVTFNNSLPNSVDIIYSSDVLEHIEPELLDETLADLFNRAQKFQYHLIACHPAKKKLNDGRNAHLIVEEPQWWKTKLENFTDWTITYEDVQEWIATPKKGPRLPIKKYIVILQKRNTQS
jgi:hypothetical protein